MLSKTDLTVGDFVPATPGGFHRARSLSDILNDSSDHSLPVLQPIKIHSRDSDDGDDVIEDEVSDDDVINDDVGDADLVDDSDEEFDDRKMSTPPTRPVRPGPPPKPKRSNVEPELGSKKSNDSALKTKPARPKPFSKAAVNSPTNKRKTPPTRPGRPPALPAEKTTTSSARNCPTPPRTKDEASNSVSKPSPPQRPSSGAVERNSIDNEAKSFPACADHELKPIPLSRHEEHTEKQTAGSGKPTAPPRRPGSKVDESPGREAESAQPVRPRSYAEHAAGRASTTPPRTDSISIEKSGNDNQTKVVRPRSDEKLTDNALSTKSITPPPRPTTPPHRPPPPPGGKSPGSKDKDVQPRSQKAKETNQQVKEAEGQSFRQRLGTLKFSRKQQREEV